MNAEIIEMIQGKELTVSELSIYHTNCQLELVLKGIINETPLVISFYNASRINMQSISKPIVIQGLEIISSKRYGWERDSNYMVHDFEDNCISFFCEGFEIQDRGRFA